MYKRDTTNRGHLYIDLEMMVASESLPLLQIMNEERRDPSGMERYLKDNNPDLNINGETLVNRVAYFDGFNQHTSNRYSIKFHRNFESFRDGTILGGAKMPDTHIYPSELWSESWIDCRDAIVVPSSKLSEMVFGDTITLKTEAILELINSPHYKRTFYDGGRNYGSAPGFSEKLNVTLSINATLIGPNGERHPEIEYFI